mgnify:CR=1 FL=1
MFLMSGSASAIINRKTGEVDSELQGPDAVLRTMEIAVNQNSFADYRSVLSDSFVYVADPGTVSMYPDINWDQWDISVEEGFMKWFLSPVLKSEMNVTERITERGMPYDNQASYVITYMIKVQGKSFYGSGKFVFEEVDETWFLLRWEEVEHTTNANTGGYHTNSGELRAAMKR